jgi:hypothetical protein
MCSSRTPSWHPPDTCLNDPMTPRFDAAHAGRRHLTENRNVPDFHQSLGFIIAQQWGKLTQAGDVRSVQSESLGNRCKIAAAKVWASIS